MRCRPMFCMVIIVLAVGLLACGSDRDTATAGEPGDGTGDDRTPPAGDVPPALEGRRFVSEFVTEDGAERPLVEGTRITLEFLDEGFLTAYAGCNHLRGPVTAESDRLVVGDLPITDMACHPPSLHDQDRWLAEFLLAGPVYTLDAPALTLQVDGTVIELIDSGEAKGGADGTGDDGQDPDEPVASEPALAGTTWRVTTIVDREAASSVPGDVVATVGFETDSVGFTVEGCNTGGADAEITGSQVVLTEPLISTMILCEGPGGEVESAIVAMLDGEGQRAIEYSLDGAPGGETLRLAHPSGRGLVLSRDG
jgi:heat shock protein HslJ